MDLDNYELDFVIWIFCPPLLIIDFAISKNLRIVSPTTKFKIVNL